MHGHNVLCPSSGTVIAVRIPFQYIRSCNGPSICLRSVPWFQIASARVGVLFPYHPNPRFPPKTKSFRRCLFTTNKLYQIPPFSFFLLLSPFRLSKLPLQNPLQNPTIPLQPLNPLLTLPHFRQQPRNAPQQFRRLPRQRRQQS